MSKAKPVVIPPTVGRVVLYRPGGDDTISCRDGEPLAAHVAAVNEDGTVNLMVLDHAGSPHRRAGVRLVQDGEEIPEGGSYCHWMPYQKGQAAKGDADVAGLRTEIAQVTKTFGDAILALQEQVAALKPQAPTEGAGDAGQE